jgi:N-acetylmuramoyl-L-alanine amidase
VALLGFAWATGVLSLPLHADPVGILGVRMGQNGPVTRFVVETSAPVEKAEVSTLSAPDRVVIDLPSNGWAGRGSSSGAGVGLVASYRVGSASGGRLRIVLDLAGPGMVRKSFSVPPDGAAPNRFVVDIEPAAADGSAAARPTQPVPVKPVSLPAAVPKPSSPPVPPKRPDLRRIVAVDPGHGGADPGTISPDGTYEKTVTLAMARALKTVMEASGRYRVVLTRDDDTFIALRDRVAKARAAGAELFISLHADSIRNRNHRGASVYTLSTVASDKEAEALANEENKSDLIAGIDLSNENPEVTNILIDLAQRETMNYSAQFAVDLVKEIDRAARVNINPHRFAGFAVLKAPDVPSVLIEMGYLSNAQDEKALKNPRLRRSFAAAILRACDGFFAGRKS